MTREEIRNAWKRVPFVPFLMHLPDGRSLRVSHPELLSLSPDGRTAWLWDRDGPGHFVDVLLISDIELLRPRRPRRSA